ncbi:MAG: glycerate kinase [Bacteroidia bacterium]|nr:glycerate kinase [Bacteroidia bacterium]
MNILLAPDKFKGSLTANEVCDALTLGLKKVHHDLNIVSVPMADGGEGTCEILTQYFRGSTIALEVTGPDYKKITAEYGISKDGSTAFIEMAKASGLQLLIPENRNPLFTTSLGTGELIKDALDRGVKKIMMGIGGSGTNDAGIGMAQVLGFEFFDINGKLLRPVGESLLQIHSIRNDHIHPRIKDVEFVALCDVDNPLFGPTGAAYIYGPQKGATEKIVKQLDDGLRNFESIAKSAFGISTNFPGSGAGGGLPGGAKLFLNISIHRGMDYIIQATGLDEKIQQADLIITGEGKIDKQTLSGKVVMEVGMLGLKYNKRVVAIAGKSELLQEELLKIGITQAFTLVNLQTSEKEAIANAFELIKENTSNQILARSR